MKTLLVIVILAIFAIAVVLVQGPVQQKKLEEEKLEQRSSSNSACIFKGDAAAGRADVWSAAHSGMKQLTEEELRGLSDKVYANCMGTPGARIDSDDPALEPNRFGRFITRAHACGKTLDKAGITGENLRTVAFTVCMAESAK